MLTEEECWERLLQEVEDIRAKLALFPELVAALREISEGKGRYSRDRLQHAENTIDDLKALAVAALAKAGAVEEVKE